MEEGGDGGGVGVGGVRESLKKKTLKKGFAPVMS